VRTEVEVESAEDGGKLKSRPENVLAQRMEEMEEQVKVVVVAMPQEASHERGGDVGQRANVAQLTHHHSHPGGSHVVEVGYKFARALLRRRRQAEAIKDEEAEKEHVR
jgi:hypothetical protein